MKVFRKEKIKDIVFMGSKGDLENFCFKLRYYFFGWCFFEDYIEQNATEVLEKDQGMGFKKK